MRRIWKILLPLISFARSPLDLSASSPFAAHARSGHCGSLLSDTDTRSRASSRFNRDPTELLTWFPLTVCVARFCPAIIMHAAARPPRPSSFWPSHTHTNRSRRTLFDGSHIRSVIAPLLLLEVVSSSLSLVCISADPFDERWNFAPLDPACMRKICLRNARDAENWPIMQKSVFALRCITYTPTSCADTHSACWCSCLGWGWVHDFVAKKTWNFNILIWSESVFKQNFFFK